MRWVLLGALLAVTVGRALGEEAPPLRLVQTIPLPHVEGRIDHLAIDLQGQRLLVAGLGNNSVEVVDLRTGKWVRSLTGFHEPQGVAFIESLGKLFVSNGGTGAVNIFAGKSFEPLGHIQFPADADNVRYDAATAQLYVGYGDGGLGIIKAEDGIRLGAVKLTAHPESFQLETSTARIFVNVPNVNQIAVVDRRTQRVQTTWALTGARANFPMGIDEVNHRLFVGCRQPAKLIVFDTESGKVVASLESVGDADDIFYDRERKRIYVVGGEGFVDVVAQRDADHYLRSARLPTSTGARTALFVPESSRFYVAVPHRGTQGAEVRDYAVQP